MEQDWSKWRKFPNPSKKEYLYSPFGYGVYQLRNTKTGENVLFGKSKNLAVRMTSLLPVTSGGAGRRNNSSKREYIWDNIDDIEYRTIPFVNEDDANKIEKTLKASNDHIYNT